MKKHIKRLLPMLLILAMVLALILTGCAPAVGPEPGGNEEYHFETFQPTESPEETAAPDDNEEYHFDAPEEMAVPNFVGANLDDILANPAYTDYFNIIPAYEASETVAEGVVMSQNPAANRLVIKSERKADIKLVVSSGVAILILPELINTDYRDAIIQLNKMGLAHEESFSKSENVAEGYVISMIPDAGTELKTGDTVFLEISTGPEIRYATMPNLIGDTISTAQAKLDGLNLVIGTITERPNDAPAGTVTWQSRSAGESVQEKTKINVIISSGPTLEPTPEPTPEPSPALPEDGSYTTKEDVALYIHLYGHLPDNFITKKEAQELGWSSGSLEKYAPGKCIGGDRFGNYEGLLPKGKNYTECDIDTLGAKSRGAKRIVYSDDGCIYYTDDHYESFTLLYGEE